MIIMILTIMILVRLSSIANGNEPILTIDGTPILN